MNDSDSDVIDINSGSGDGSCTCTIQKNNKKKNGDDSESHDGKYLGQKKANVSIVDLDTCSDLDHDHVEVHSSSSSSSSSGIPSPCLRGTQTRRAIMAALPLKNNNDFPPSVIHTKSPTTIKPARKSKPAKKKRPNNNITSNKEDEISCTGMSTTSPLSRSNVTKEPTCAKENKQPKGAKPSVTRRKKGQWGYNKKKSVPKTTDSSISRDSSTPPAVANTKTKSADDDTTKHFHCYLLRSLDPDHPITTYIGFTTHPQRRLRQHNGILKNSGARKTKRAGRPWTFVCVVHGFQDRITALQFEWAWQHTNKSLAFREAVGGDQLAGKMKRRYGPKARLDELRVLVTECLPFCLYSLTIYFPEREYRDLYSSILRRGKDGNPYKKNDDESEAYEPLTNFELCILENMPVAREIAASKKKKAAEREAKKTAGKNKSPTAETPNYSSDVSEWLDDYYLSDLDDNDDNGDDDAGSKCSNLKTIAENNSSSSVDLCQNGTDNNGKSAAASKKRNAFIVGKPPESHQDHTGVDGTSKDFLSLSIDVSQKQHALTENTEGCDFSTISSSESTSQCSIGTHDALVVASNVPKQPEKESQQPLSDCASHYSAIDKVGKKTIAKMCDIVDLCDSP